MTQVAVDMTQVAVKVTWRQCVVESHAISPEHPQKLSHHCVESGHVTDDACNRRHTSELGVEAKICSKAVNRHELVITTFL